MTLLHVADKLRVNDLLFVGVIPRKLVENGHQDDRNDDPDGEMFDDIIQDCILYIVCRLSKILSPFTG